jgi:hypothetical protein
MPICLVFSPDSSEKLFEMELHFITRKERPKRAPFIVYKNVNEIKKLVTNSWICF